VSRSKEGCPGEDYLSQVTEGVRKRHTMGQSDGCLNGRDDEFEQKEVKACISRLDQNYGGLGHQNKRAYRHESMTCVE
jgi:hypothetical protein